MTENTPENNKQEAEPVLELEAPEVVEEAPLLEPEVSEQPERKPPHPLQPGGRRFEQIYAGKKQAEREVSQLRERLAATEAKIDLLTKGFGNTNQTKDEYSWNELEGFIAEGRITRAEAQQHREEVVARNIQRKFERDQSQRTKELTREQFLDQTIQSYIGAVPAILKADSPERQRMDEEFDTVALILGIDPEDATPIQRKQIQAAALRNVYGNVDSVTRRNASVKLETQQETGGGDRPKLKPNPDQELINKLSKVEVEHYKKMFKAGRYPNKWKDVVEELKFVKPGSQR